MASQLPSGWQVLSSEYLHQEPWLTVRKDKLELPNGHLIEKYFVLEYPDWVNVIAITKDEQFVMVKQYRHAMGNTSFELCAGVADETDASFTDAAKRELLEETGYGGGHWEEWMVIAANPATSNNKVHCFLATGVEKLSEPAPEASEDITVHLCNADELKEMMLGEAIIQGLHLAPLWKYFAQRC